MHWGEDMFGRNADMMAMSGIPDGKQCILKVRNFRNSRTAEKLPWDWVLRKPALSQVNFDFP